MSERRPSQREFFELAATQELRESMVGRSDVEASLSSLVAQARARWPEVKLEDGDYLAFVAEKLEGEPRFDVAELDAEDLFLACGCSLGDRAAIKALDGSLSGWLDGALARFRNSVDSEDVKQQVRTRLLVGQEGRRPKISTYGGRSPLRSWVRVVAVRIAINMTKGSGRNNLDDEVVARLPAEDDDPEIALLRERCRAEFKSAVAEAVATLEPRERNLLRLQMFDGLSIDEIGALHDVHRSTAARWLSTLRDKLRKTTVASLRKKLEINASEVRSLVRMVASQLEVSLERILDSSGA